MENTKTIRELELRKVQRPKGSSNQVAYSSLAPPSCTSESDFDSNHDLTIVVLHKENQCKTPGVPEPKKSGNVAMISSFAMGFLTTCACVICVTTRGSSTAQDSLETGS